MPVVRGGDTQHVNVLVVHDAPDILLQSHFLVVGILKFLLPFFQDVHVRIAQVSDLDVLCGHKALHMAFPTAVQAQDGCVYAVVGPECSG